MSSADGYKLEELAREAGVSPRTVRYYVQRGLLAPPVFRGKDTVYSQEHLARLRAIRTLQEKFLPLDAIQAELAGRKVEEVERLVEPRVPSPGARWERWSLAPGLEIHVAEDVDAPTRSFARELCELALRRARKGR